MKTRQTVTHVPVERLTAHPGNIREDLGDLTELAASIREHGILSPLIVTEDPDTAGQMLLLAGHRRLGASLRAGLRTVPCIIRHDLGHDAAEQTVVMLVENCQRRDLTPVEKAEAYGALRNRNLTLSEISRRVGVSVGTISYYLALLDLDEASLEAVRQGELPSTEAIAAVRQVRQSERTQSGRSRRGRPVVVERPHFSVRHPLARYAKATCAHTDAPTVGGVACGACWESVIRADAHGVLPILEDPKLDAMAVVRAVDGDTSVKLTVAERREAIRQLHSRRLSDGQIADVLGISDKTVERARKLLELPANCGASGRIA